MSAGPWARLSRWAALVATAAGAAGILLPDATLYLAALGLLIVWALAGIIAAGLARQTGG